MKKFTHARIYRSSAGQIMIAPYHESRSSNRLLQQVIEPRRRLRRRLCVSLATSATMRFKCDGLIDN
jgi:hypothetical protein